ncbi:hypothetical protein K461DRAFT_321024 [Myriangium duriaei CBS 260.36]|uniref:F-box domain-containing protein n=1 Tax=Myriangium duriaei CBS 260.36 TaxID=1168546 RepID=A0A9P4MGA0_9PEZI|nr:hypothetical protein K461DRAFT_321024 [Myriangium duriaei CBS 260.36]
MTKSPLEKCPNEVLTMILEEVEAGELTKIRLVCKKLATIGAKELFRSIVFTTAPGSAERFMAVASHECFAGYVKEVRFCQYIDSGLIPYSEHDLQRLYEQADDFRWIIAHFDRLTNLKAVTLDFGDNSVPGWEHHKAWRQYRLRDMIHALHHHNMKLHNLSIMGMDDSQDDKLTSRKTFGSALSDLRALHIDIRRRHRVPIPYSQATLNDESMFWPSFRSGWAEPLSSHLTFLSLGNAYHWGLLPVRFTLVGVCFPSLRTLKLSKLTMSSDHQLIWIVAQKSLRRISLHDCSIARTIILSGEYYVDWTGDDLPTDAGDYIYLKTSNIWMTNFRRIQDELGLLEFSFSFSTNDDYPHDDHRLSHRRYTDYFADHAPFYGHSITSPGGTQEYPEYNNPESHWYKAFGDIFTPQHDQDTFGKDAAALEALQETIDQRVKEQRMVSRA